MKELVKSEVRISDRSDVVQVLNFWHCFLALIIPHWSRQQGKVILSDLNMLEREWVF